MKVTTSKPVDTVYFENLTPIMFIGIEISGSKALLTQNEFQKDFYSFRIIDSLPQYNRFGCENQTFKQAVNTYKHDNMVAFHTLKEFMDWALS